MNTKYNNDLSAVLNNEDETTLDANTNSLDNVSFLHKPVTITPTPIKHINKLGKGIHKRKQVKGGRAMVATRLTAEQEAKLQWLVKASTENYGTQATVSSVIAELIDKAMPVSGAA